MGKAPKWGVNNYVKRTKKKDPIVMLKALVKENQKLKNIEVKVNK